MLRRLLLAAAVALSLAACDDAADQAEAPPPATPTREAVTHFGGMVLLDHAGPRAQAHLKSGEILWFPAVSDLVAFTLLPEESKAVAALYVSDMATSTTWAAPETWMPAEDGFYVIDSDARGGMAMPEAVPFSTLAAAEAFTAEHGGRVVKWGEIPQDYVLGGPDEDMQMQMPMPMTHGEQHGSLAEPTVIELLNEPDATCLPGAVTTAATEVPR